MNISDAGLDLIKAHEGVRLTAYPDPGTGGEPWTIGYGHTGGVQKGDTCSQEDADEWLRQDVKKAESCINAAVTAPLTQNKFDALCSFVYNVGCGTFKTSSVLSKLNDSDYDGAIAVLKKYNHAGGQVLAGLTARRNAEADLFETA